MTDPKLADALRKRANWLRNKTGSHLEDGWADTKNVIGALLEMADVIDSVNGVYISKEDLEDHNLRIRYGGKDNQGFYHEAHPDAGRYRTNEPIPGEIPWKDRKRIKKPG